MNQSFEGLLFQVPETQLLTAQPLAPQFSADIYPVKNFQVCPQKFACQPGDREPGIVPPCRKVSRTATGQVFKRQHFDNMIGAFKASGGTARADDFALLLQEREKGDFVTLARQLVSRDIFSFEFQNHFWIPMLQFNLADLSMKRTFSQIVGELDAKMDSWSLAQWLTEPNAWLNSNRPADMVDPHFAEVMAAARADRFVASG